jgi:hypothetical protein
MTTITRIGTIYAIIAWTGRLAMAAVMAKSEQTPEIRDLVLLSMRLPSPIFWIQKFTPNMTTMAQAQIGT